MSKKTITPVVALAGAALAGGLVVSGIAGAAENPFAADSMKSGYMVLAEAEGEGKCGGKQKSEEEGKCGSEKEKTESEGKCGSSD